MGFWRGGLKFPDEKRKNLGTSGGTVKKTGNRNHSLFWQYLTADLQLPICNFEHKKNLSFPIPGDYLIP